MIEINLVRQLPTGTTFDETSKQGYGLIIVVLFLGIGVASWGWTQVKHQESIKKIASLNHLAQEVALLREKLPPRIQQLSVRVEPRAFRRDIVNIGKRTGVVVRLWKPKKSLMAIEHSEVSLDIVVKVEGSFHGTVRFLDELLQVSWIQAVNPLGLHVISQYPDPANSTPRYASPIHTAP